MIEYLHVSRDGFLLDGWRLPFVVEPAMGHHGAYSVTV